MTQTPRASVARFRFMLSIVGTVTGTVAVVWGVYLPAARHITRQITVLHELQARITDARLVVAQRPAYEASLRQARERYPRLEEQLTDSPSIAKVLETLHGLAAQHRVQLTVVQPRTEETSAQTITLLGGATLREVPLTMRLTGRYRQIAEFLGACGQIPFLSSVRQLTMKKLQPNSLLVRADGVFAIYLHEPTGGS